MSAGEWTLAKRSTQTSITKGMAEIKKDKERKGRFSNGSFPIQSDVLPWRNHYIIDLNTHK